MSLSTVSLGAALTSATSNAGVKPEDADANFLRGGNILAIIQPTNGAFVGTAKIQGSNSLDSVADGSAVWDDILTFVAPASNSGSKVAVVANTYRRLRLTVSVFTSGSVTGMLVA
jgi:hypothetical protein